MYNMKNYNYMKTRYLIPILFGALLNTSCNEFLDLDPEDSQTETVYFKTAAQFQEAANYLHTDCCNQRVS